MMNVAIQKRFKMKNIFYLLLLLQFQNCFSQNITEIQQVFYVCNWKPPTPKEVLDINKPLPTAKELQQIIQDGTGQDKMIVSNKGKTHFYSLPNINCKSELFIVKKDIIFWLNSYKDGNNEFTKVAYISESLKKIIIGWIPSQGICQYEPTQSLKVRCGI